MFCPACTASFLILRLITRDASPLEEAFGTLEQNMQSCPENSFRGVYFCRELSQASKPAGGAAVGVIAALAVAWSGAESPKALADLDLPYQVHWHCCEVSLILALLQGSHDCALEWCQLSGPEQRGCRMHLCFTSR